MIKDPAIFLAHILESIEKIENYLAEISEEEFMSDYEKQDAVVRRLEVIGEAVKNLPDATKIQFTEIEWNKIIAMRNLLIHEYFGVDMKLVWNVMKKRLPELKEVIKNNMIEK